MKKVFMVFIFLFLAHSLQAGGITLTDAEDVKLGEGGLQIHTAPPQKETTPVSVPAPVPVQTTKPAINFNKVKFGMGGGFGLTFVWAEENYAEQWKTPTKILFPIQVYEHFRIEPFFTFALNHYKNGGSYSNFFEFLVGSGLFYTHPFKSTMFIVGARIAGGATVYTTHATSEYESDDWYYRPCFAIEPVIGADYFLSDHFSIGGEVTLGMTYYGKDHEKDHDSSNDDGETQFFLHTTGTIYFRWYFF